MHPASRWWTSSTGIGRDCAKTASHQTASLDPRTKVLCGRTLSNFRPSQCHHQPYQRPQWAGLHWTGIELPASVAVPCGRKQGGPDRPLCQLSSSTTDEDDRVSFRSKPRESGRSSVAGSTPPSSSTLTPLVSTTTRPSTTKVDPAAMDGMWGTLPLPYKLYSA